MIARRRIPHILAAAWFMMSLYVAIKIASVLGSHGAPGSPWVAIPDFEVPSLFADRRFGGREFVRLETKDAPLPAGWMRGPNDRFMDRSVVFGADGSARMVAGDDRARFLGTWRFADGELCLILTAVDPEDTGRQVDRCFDLYRHGPRVMLWSGPESRWLAHLS